MNNLGPKFLRFDNIAKGDRMSLSHVAAHNPNTITIDEILWKIRGTATSKCCTQTGYGGAVSYTGLILNRDNAESAAEELFHQVVLFNVQCRATERGYAQRMIDFTPIG